MDSVMDIGADYPQYNFFFSLSLFLNDRNRRSIKTVVHGLRSQLSTFKPVKQALANSCIDLLKGFG